MTTLNDPSVCHRTQVTQTYFVVLFNTILVVLLFLETSFYFIRI